MARFTMTEVAERLQLPKTTLYQYIRELKQQLPEIGWYSKHGKHRRFSENQIAQLEEAIWPEPPPPRDFQRPPICRPT